MIDSLYSGHVGRPVRLIVSL